MFEEDKENPETQAKAVKRKHKSTKLKIKVPAGLTTQKTLSATAPKPNLRGSTKNLKEDRKGSSFKLQPKSKGSSDGKQSESLTGQRPIKQHSESKLATIDEDE